MLFQVFGVGRRHFLEQIQLSLGHRFDNELLVVAEEKETSTASSTLAGFKDHLTVEPWTEALVKVFEVVDVAGFVKALKVINHVESHLHPCVDNDRVLIILICY